MSTARKKNKYYSYADYLQWDDSVRAELIYGEIYDMSPAPSRKHQELSMTLSVLFGAYLKGKTCRVFAAPFDVRFPGKSQTDYDIDTVVQPDISIVCDMKKLDERGCVGAPDMIIEIISPESAVRDMREKLNLYEKHNVKEYWIVHPAEKTLMVYLLDKEGKYPRHAVYSSPDKVKVRTVKGLFIDLADLFKE